MLYLMSLFFLCLLKNTLHTSNKSNSAPFTPALINLPTVSNIHSNTLSLISPSFDPLPISETTVLVGIKVEPIVSSDPLVH